MAKKKRRWDRRRYPKRKKAYFSNNKKRNFDDPAYKAWRRAVYKRDGYKCQWPGCKCRGRIFAHHILTWAVYPSLRFSVNNGITLCKEHHDMVTGKEDDYVRALSNILLQQARKKNDKRK